MPKLYVDPIDADESALNVIVEPQLGWKLRLQLIGLKPMVMLVGGGFGTLKLTEFVEAVSEKGRTAETDIDTLAV